MRDGFVIGGTRIDLLALAIIEGFASIGLFAYLSACVVAILFGPRERPAFIRLNAWMFTKPENALEWFGFGVAVWIALVCFLLPFSMTTYLAGADYGPLGKAFLYATYVPMAGWIVYLIRIYRTN